MPKKPSLKSLDAELAKIQKSNNEKLNKIYENQRKEEENQRQKEEIEQIKKRTKKIIINGIHGIIKLENVTIDINNSMQTLINLIITKLKIYNIVSIIINNISYNLYDTDMKYNFYEEYNNLLWDQIKKYVNIDNEKDVIEITIVCGSIKPFLKNLIIYFLDGINDMVNNNSDSEYIDHKKFIKKKYNKWFKNELKKIFVKKYDFSEIYEEILLFLENLNETEFTQFIINELKMLLN